MQTRMEQTAKSGGIFFYLFLLTGFFLLVEISFFIQCNKAYLSDFNWVSSNIKIPATVLPGIFYFIFAQFIVHISYCLLIAALTFPIAKSWRLAPNQKITLAMSLWGLGIATALVANQYYFPNSKFAGLTSILLFRRYVTIAVYLILGMIDLTVVAVALFSFYRLLTRKARVSIFIAFICAAILLMWCARPIPTIDAGTEEKPNIILIGMDSLRPDFLSFFGHSKQTPFLDSLLKESSVFSQSITPLARTFPSWSSILTGLYPRQTGVRFNLPQPQKIMLTNTLPTILQQQGYQTVFATDETRFSNMDKNYGFEKIITPPIGLNDFLLGTFNDFPLSNLLVNTPVGKLLFPHSFANRPVYVTYEPNSFLNLIRPTLEESRSKPLFLTIHFCLTHFPYLWGSLSGGPLNITERYDESVGRVDEQLQQFFVLLKETHLLDHAIVVLLSDHGEALELPGDRITEKDLFVQTNHKKIPLPKFYPPSLDHEEINQSAGHGTDVLGLPQYHTLLAFKLYGTGQQQYRTIAGRVNVMDIKPTILGLLGFKTDHCSKNNIQCESSYSLAPLIHGSQQNVSSKPVHLFLESDYSPEAIRTVYPETRKVMLEGIQLFQINPLTTRLSVKDSMAKMIINSKQYADIYGDWMLALYPQNNHFRMPILINLTTGQWTNDLHSNFAQHSPSKLMLTEMKNFFGNDLNNV